MARKLIVPEKTGFKVNDIYQPIIIRDYRGILFYSTEDVLPKCTKFNLPAGEYMVDTGYFSPMPFPVKYPMIKLPFPQRFMPSTQNFSISFGSNKNKCTVNWDQRHILFDTSFREKPLNQLFGIRFHEEGHKRYNGTKKGESNADLFAVNKLLAMGFNPMQCGPAFWDSLSDNSEYRKQNIYNKLIKYVV